MRSHHHPISKIAIIGAGPVGLAFAKYLLAEKAFRSITIYEQRDRVGGVWNLSGSERTRGIPVPQVDSRYGCWQTSSGEAGSGGIDGKREDKSASLEFESPLYDYLETNIPKGLMAYSDKAFPVDAPLFPNHQQVLRYLEEYEEEVRHLIRFQCQVRNVRLAGEGTNSSHDVWRMEVEDLKSGAASSDLYDAVVVANGHYSIPSLPRIKGIDEWNAAYPGIIIHSKAYRRPEEYRGKKVLVIGNSASGVDIAFQVSQECAKPVLLSSRSESAWVASPSAAWKKDVDEVIEFLPASEFSRAIRLKSGGIETDIDAVIFATGYFYSYPFLSELAPSVVTDGLRVQDVYHHLFHIKHPTMVFPVINLKVIPFPLAENQAAVVARVWSGRLDLPPEDEMRDWARNIVKEKGNGKYFHLKKFPEDAAQINELYRWAQSAAKRPGLDNDGDGKLGAAWDEKQVWLRSRFGEIKRRYTARGSERTRVTHIEELGLDFDAWRKTAKVEDAEMFKAAKCGGGGGGGGNLCGMSLPRNYGPP